jgi:hypothetical protein
MESDMPPLGRPNSVIIWVIVVSASVIALASLPYAAVYLTTPPDLRFVGTLLNPLDGDSYLAKMQLGAQGDWLFHLPYTAQDHPGAFVFAYYLALGHVAEWTHLPIPFVYHLMRIIAGFVLLSAVYALVANVMQDLAERRLAFLFVALSSGLGWLAVVLGHLGTSDLLVPESNTFFSLHINPHFPMAMALMVGMLLLGGRGPRGSREPRVGRPEGEGWGIRLVTQSAMSLALAIVQPFAVVIVYATLGVSLLLRWQRDGRIPWPQVWMAFIAGAVTLPLSVYTLWVTQADPVLRGWTAQNVTPSPPVWDYALGYGLVLALAVPGAVVAIRRRTDLDLLLLAWVGVTAIALYAPFALQRRLSLGLHIPLAILAAMGLARLTKRRLVTGLAFAATLLTTLLVVVLAIGGGMKHDSKLFVSADEAAAMDWLHEHTPRDAVVLASPEMGLFIPAWAGRRVVYGHPFETVNAEQTRARVETFFASGTSRAERDAMLTGWNVAFVFVGPRERALGMTELPGREVFHNATVTICQP